MAGFGLQKYIIPAGLYITAYFLHSSVILADSLPVLHYFPLNINVQKCIAYNIMEVKCIASAKRFNIII